jgi:RNA polymerase sigma factor (sigma-70 family)
MTKDQRNRELIVKAQAGDRAAMETLLSENTLLIQSVARRYRTHLKFCEWDDLMQVGRIGFVRAVEKFDLARPVHFCTYAHQWIRQMMGRLIEKDRLIHIPNHMQTPEHKGKEWVGCCRSLDRRIGDSADAFYGDLLAAPDNVERDVIGLATPETAAAAEALATANVPEPEMAAFRLRHGLDDNIPRTLQEIADEMGISREAARNRCNRAAYRLRRYIERKGLLR